MRRQAPRISGYGVATGEDGHGVGRHRLGVRLQTGAMAVFGQRVSRAGFYARSTALGQCRCAHGRREPRGAPSHQVDTLR
jgi:hypothetical protein